MPAGAFPPDGPARTDSAQRFAIRRRVLPGPVPAKRWSIAAAEKPGLPSHPFREPGPQHAGAPGPLIIVGRWGSAAARLPAETAAPAAAARTPVSCLLRHGPEVARQVFRAAPAHPLAL